MYGSATHKFLMAHELGHAIANRIEGTDVGRDTNCGGWDRQPDPPENNCRAEVGSGAPKTMFSMEYQAMAAREGWADFIAAWLWNNPSQSDCTHGRWGTASDFDLDDDDATPSGFPPDIDDADNNFSGAIGWVNCEGIPITSATCADWGATCTSGGHVPLESYVTARDWVEDLTAASDPMGCTAASLTNRGSTGDWMRFFWDLRTDENVSMAALADLWDNMDMSTVDSDDNNDLYGVLDCGITGTSDDVTVRLTAAAAATTCGGTPTDCVDEVNAQKNNGQDH